MVLRPGIVYLICDPANDFYKIGVTTAKSAKRLKQLQTGNGTELHIVHEHHTNYPFLVEKMLHNKYSYLLEHGEWFRLPPADVIGFEKICEVQEQNIAALRDSPFFAKYLK